MLFASARRIKITMKDAVHYLVKDWLGQIGPGVLTSSNRNKDNLKNQIALQKEICSSREKSNTRSKLNNNPNTEMNFTNQNSNLFGSNAKLTQDTL